MGKKEHQSEEEKNRCDRRRKKRLFSFSLFFLLSAFASLPAAAKSASESLHARRGEIRFRRGSISRLKEEEKKAFGLTEKKKGKRFLSAFSVPSLKRARARERERESSQQVRGALVRLESEWKRGRGTRAEQVPFPLSSSPHSTKKQKSGNFSLFRFFFDLLLKKQSENHVCRRDDEDGQLRAYDLSTAAEKS